MNYLQKGRGNNMAFFSLNLFHSVSLWRFTNEPDHSLSLSHTHTHTHTHTELLLIEHILLHKITKSSLQIRFPVLNACTYKYTRSYVQVCIHINPPSTPRPFFALKQLFCTFVLKSQSCPDLKENLKIIHTYRNNQDQPCFMLQKKAQHMRDGLK